MRIRHLRVRIKELASEAKHIRHEAAQCSGMEKWELNHHRTSVVRPAARQYLLAYGYLRGTPYREIERSVKRPPNWTKIANIIDRFGGDSEGLKAWRDAPAVEKAAAA